MSVLLQGAAAAPQLWVVAEVFVPAGYPFNPRRRCVPLPGTTDLACGPENLERATEVPAPTDSRRRTRHDAQAKDRRAPLGCRRQHEVCRQVAVATGSRRRTRCRGEQPCQVSGIGRQRRDHDDGGGGQVVLVGQLKMRHHRPTRRVAAETVLCGCVALDVLDGRLSGQSLPRYGRLERAHEHLNDR